MVVISERWPVEGLNGSLFDYFKFYTKSDNKQNTLIVVQALLFRILKQTLQFTIEGYPTL